MKRPWVVIGILSLILPACRWKVPPTYPASQIASGLTQICSKDYKLEIEARHEGKVLQAQRWEEKGLFGGHAYDLQGMSKGAGDTLEHMLLCATRVALSTDASLDFIEVKMVDLLTGASITLWRYVPDIRDSMYQRMGDTEYFSRLVIEIDVDKRNLVKNSPMRWDKPLSLAEFLAKQVISRARREGAETLQAHTDLSQPSTLGVVIDNWASIEEQGPEHVNKMTDALYKSAQTVLKGYHFKGFRGLTLRDSDGVAVGSWAL